MKQLLVPLAVVAVAVAALGVTVWLWASPSASDGSDGHAHFDPITTAEETAVAVMVGMHTWHPPSEDSPWESMHTVRDRMTGPMAEAAASKPDPDPAPPQWGAWARSGDRITGAAEVAAGHTLVDPAATEVTVPVAIRQVVMHRDGQTTPLDEQIALVEMVRSGDRWLAAEFSYQRTIE